MKETDWPPLYMHPLPILQSDGVTVVDEACQFLLPHEVLEQLFQLGDTHVLQSLEGLDAPSRVRMESIRREWDDDGVVALSLWGDSVPTSWDRSESIMLYAWGLPGLVDASHKGLRVPITGY